MRGISDALIKDAKLSSLFSNQLQHKNNCQDFSLNSAILSLNCPPKFLLISFDDLGQNLLMFIKRKSWVEVWYEIDELASCILAWGEQKIF